MSLLEQPLATGALQIVTSRSVEHSSQCAINESKSQDRAAEKLTIYKAIPCLLKQLLIKPSAREQPMLLLRSFSCQPLKPRYTLVKATLVLSEKPLF